MSFVEKKKNQINQQVKKQQNRKNTTFSQINRIIKK